MKLVSEIPKNPRRTYMGLIKPQNLVLTGLEFDNINHIVDIKSDLSFSTVMTATKHIQCTMNMISPTSSSGLTAWFN